MDNRSRFSSVFRARAFAGQKRFRFLHRLSLNDHQRHLDFAPLGLTHCFETALFLFEKRACCVISPAR